MLADRGMLKALQSSLETYVASKLDHVDVPISCPWEHLCAGRRRAATMHPLCALEGALLPDLHTAVQLTNKDIMQKLAIVLEQSRALLEIWQLVIEFWQFDMCRSDLFLHQLA